MLPAHAYPRLKAYPHLFGNYGTAWQNQKKEFAAFPGAILMTTNCIQEPQASYLKNIFTRATVGWPGAAHIQDRDFSPVIERALALPGFPADVPEQDGPTWASCMSAVLAHAEKIIELVKAGKIRHFFLVGGCDGAKPGRNYYTQFVEEAPADTVILTLACGKFRFYDKDLGTIDGIPRLLDMGQCNDAYSAIQVALALADAFDVGVNDLPLTLDPLLVRAESVRDTPDPAASGSEGHAPWPYPARLLYSGSGAVHRRQLQPTPCHHSR